MKNDATVRAKAVSTLSLCHRNPHSRKAGRPDADEVKTAMQPLTPKAEHSMFGQIEAQLRLMNDRAAARDFTMDVRLAWLAGQVGNVANNTSCAQNLLRVAAVTVAWLEAMELPPVFVHTSIAEGCLRQRQVFTAKNISLSDSAPATECWRKLRVLVARLGRVAQAVDELDGNPDNNLVRNHLMAELVEVAAVAIVWREAGEAENQQ